MSSKCIDHETITSLVNDTLPSNVRGEVIRHLDDCADCQAKIDDAFSENGDLAVALSQSDSQSLKLSEAMERLISDTASLDLSRNDSDYLDRLRFAFDASLRPNGIGRFAGLEIDGFLGAGGMGIVLKAFDDSLQRHVAIKLLPPGTAASQESRQRFLREARAAAAIDHENVVTIHSVDEFNGLPYLIMQYVDGESLYLLLERRSPLPLVEIQELAYQAASGLVAAHRKGIIHRDVKPANILIEHETGKALLTDFGLAQTISEDRLTQSGHTAGTPCFMSPEQAKAESLDARSDLFSLGAVLYTAATGASPFEGKSVYAVIRNVCEKNPPPVAEVNPEIPIWMSDVIEKLMRKAPQQRFESAQELLDELQKKACVPQAGSIGGVRIHDVPQRKTASGFRTAGWAIGLIAMALVAGYVANSFLLFAGKHDEKSQASGQLVLPFQLVGTDQQFETLEEAIAQADEGSIIEVSGDGPFLISDCQIEKELTIRNAENSSPVFRQQDGIKGPAITSASHLSLDGITLQFGKKLFSGIESNRHYVVNSLLAIQGGELSIVDCTFHAQKGGMAVWFDGSRCNVTASRFGEDFSAGIAWDCNSDSVVEVNNCLLESRTGIMAITNMNLSDLRLESRIDSNTFLGDTAIFIFPKRTSRASREIEVLPDAFLTIAANNNLFHVNSLLSLKASPRVDSSRLTTLLKYMVAWKGRQNVFSTVDCFSSASNVRTQNDRAIHGSFTEWTGSQDEAESAVAKLSIGRPNDSGFSAVNVDEWIEGSPVEQFGVDGTTN